MTMIDLSLDVSAVIGILALGVSIGTLIGICIWPMDRYQ